ncbi:MAG: peptidoglycan-binding domain-containing protein [Patescibacteria group bacterium]
MRKFILSSSLLVVGLLVLFSPLAGRAAQLTSAQISAIINLLQSFGASSSVVSNVQTALNGGNATSTAGGLFIQSNSNGLALITLLREGDNGDNVRTLQIALSADASVYPEGLITGYFGPLTAKAVKRFQKKHNLENEGQVGEKTREKINKLLTENSVEVEDRDGQRRPCAKVPPGHLIAPGWLRKQGGVRPLVPPCQILPPGIVKNPHNNSTSTPPVLDITLPIITNLVATSTTATTTQITWHTNEAASSVVWYATSTPVMTARPHTRMSVGGLLFDRTINLSGLVASSTYHYLAVSADFAGNTATSSEQIFSTQ